MTVLPVSPRTAGQSSAHQRHAHAYERLPTGDPAAGKQRSPSMAGSPSSCAANGSAGMGVLDLPALPPPRPAVRAGSSALAGTLRSLLGVGSAGGAAQGPSSPSAPRVLRPLQPLQSGTP